MARSMPHFSPLCVLLLLCCAQVNSQLSVNVSEQGDYSISREDGTVWLQSAPTFFIIDNVTYSAADSTLTLKQINQTTDPTSTKYNLMYEANNVSIMATISVYDQGQLGFTVTFPDGASNTKATSPDHVICGFPGFRFDPSPARFGYMSFGLSSLEAAIGRWENGTGITIVYGGRQGSGPLVLFDQTHNTITMGPMSSFTVTSLWHDVDGAAAYWGIMGGVTQLPPGFQYGVLLTETKGKVGKAMVDWGMKVREMGYTNGQNSGVGQVQVIEDPILDTLGYWTGPGSAYYTAPEPGKNYADTLYDVRMDAANDTNPEPVVDYEYVEVDDWWYTKGQGGGVKTWTAPASVFPDGIIGMARKTLWNVAAAGGVWATDNTYSKSNGGQYDFVDGLNCSLPLDQALWADLFNTTAGDGIRAYIQKDMEQQYMCMTSGDSDVTTILSWLSHLNFSATTKDMEVMYSGAIPRLVMETAFNQKLQPVVQVGPGPGNLTEKTLWKVGVANLFMASMGLSPFYGIMRSDDNTNTGSQLPQILHSILASLTGGPIAFGDEIGKSDRMFIERCCSATGKILYPSPDHPARPIDDQLQEMVWGSTSGSIGEIWTTYTGNIFNTDKANNFFMGIILATAMTGSYDITPTSAGFDFTSVIPGEKMYVPSKVFSYYNPSVLYDFSDQKPLRLSNCTVDNFCLYYAAPVFNFKGREVVLMGDLTKWVPLSSVRVESIQVGDTIQVRTRGEPGEKVYMWFQVDGHLQSLEHRITLGGTGIVEYQLPPTSAAPPSGLAPPRYLLFVILCLVLFSVVKMF